jgi:hypothetical protein
MMHIKNKRKISKKNRNKHTTNQREEIQIQQQYTGLFSFAWLVYPVLLNIFQEREYEYSNSSKKSKKKKKKKDKVASDSPKNNN